MKVKLEELKSARVVDDPEEIATLLTKRPKQDSETGLPSQTNVSVGDTDEGVARIEKVSGLSIIGKDASQPEMPSMQGVQALAERRGIAWTPDLAGRAVPYWASDERVDSYGDIVRQDWILDDFQKNPVMPWSHGWGGLPIGNSIDEQVIESRTDGDYNGPALWLLGLFATKAMSEMADSAFRLIKARFLRAGSVGFRSHRIIDVKDEDERQKLGLGRWGFVLERNQLLEFSPCLLGANTGALTLLSQAKQKGELVPGDFQLIRDLARSQVARGSRSKEEWNDVDSRYRGLARVIFPSLKLDAHRELDEPFVYEEDQTLRNARVTRSDEDDDTKQLIAALNVRLDALENTIENGFVSVSEQIETLRITSEEKDTTDDDSSEESGDENTLGRVLSGIERMTAKLGGARTA